MGYDYNWLVKDNDNAIRAGADAETKYNGVIQADDDRGGYNTKFTLPAGVLGNYHIHFKLGSTQVKVIRFIPPNGGQGINVVMLKDGGTGVTLSRLYNNTLFQGGNYPNSYQLLKNLRDAVEDLKPGPNGQYQ